MTDDTEKSSDGRRKERTETRGNLVESFVIAFSMYSRIPMPTIEWSDAGMRYALCFFPLIGVVIGAAETFFCAVHVRAAFGTVAYACIGTAIPLIITGGIHMDGFLDTVDARSSFAERERKLEILKDAHTGAFAVIGGCVYLLLYAAAFSELGADAFPAIGGIHVMARAFSGLSVTLLPKARKDGLASTFAAHAGVRAVYAAMGVWILVSFCFLYSCTAPIVALAILAAVLLVFAWYARMAMREFGGMTGDLAGFFLQAAELVMVAVLAVCR